MSVCTMPRSSYTAAKHGISISTPLVVPSVRRTCGAWAKPTTATSRKVMLSYLLFAQALIGAIPLEVVFVGVVVGVGLTRRPEVLDVVDAEPPPVTRPPHCLDPHAHPDVGGIDLQDQVQEGDVGAV